MVEVPSIQSLVQYFQTIHSLTDNYYELRGVQISTYETSAVNSVREEHNCSCKQCCAVGLYAMCNSIAKSCSYWNSKTLCCIAEQGNQFYCNMGINRHLTKADLYTSPDICGVEISVQLKAQSYGMLSGSLNNTKKTGKFNFQQLQRKCRVFIMAFKLLYYLYFSTNSQSKVHVLFIDI